MLMVDGLVSVTSPWCSAAAQLAAHFPCVSVGIGLLLAVASATVVPKIIFIRTLIAVHARQLAGHALLAQGQTDTRPAY